MVGRFEEAAERIKGALAVLAVGFAVYFTAFYVLDRLGTWALGLNS